MALGFMLGAAAVLFVGFVGVAALTPVYHRDIINIVLWVLITVVSASFGINVVLQPDLPEWLSAALGLGLSTLMGFVLTYNMVRVVSPVYVRHPVLRAVFKAQKDPEDKMRAKVEEQQRIEGEQWVRANLYITYAVGGGVS
jgi:hypothetical protein